MTPRSPTPGAPSPAPPAKEDPIDGSPCSPNPSTAGIPGAQQGRRPDIDPETGHLRPIPEDEWRARQEELTRRLAEIDAEDDTPDEIYDEFMRNLDEERRRQGRPPAFEGCY